MTKNDHFFLKFDDFPPILRDLHAVLPLFFRTTFLRQNLDLKI